MMAHTIRISLSGMPPLLRWVFFLPLLAILGCLGRPDPLPPVTEPLDPGVERSQRDSVLQWVGSMKRQAIDSAFTRLAALAYTRSCVARELAPNGDTVASRRWSERIAGPLASRQLAVAPLDSSGSFSDGYFGWFSSRAMPAEHSTELARFILPEDPPYLSGRGREAYRFRMLSDTTIAGRAVRRFLIEAHPEGGNAQRMRRVRLAIDATSGEVVDIEALIDQFSLLYQERSRFRLSLQPIDGAWVPRRIDLDTRLGSAVFEQRHFQVSAVYEDLRPTS